MDYRRTGTACTLAALLLAFSAAELRAGDDPEPTEPLSIMAVRLTTEIELDGKLDEFAWIGAHAVTGFRQWQPDEGEPATQRTEVRFLFDDDALYVGARMYDDLGAEGVTSRLARRDQDPDADLLTIIFDTFHDHLGQTEFSINPAGVKGDAYGPGSSWPDPSWDPVWKAKTSVDSLGWTAELRIPLSQLRFPRDSVQTWGLQIRRYTARLNERSQWAFWPQTESGGPSRYGHLEGLSMAASPSRAEFLPYIVGRSVKLDSQDADDPFNKGHHADYRAGVDMKLSLTSNLTLTATINPDFGQVEVDPAVVNLSAFETYFPERRPFFVEGRGFLRYGGLWCFFCSNTSGLNLFYSRRIGRSPQVSDNAYDAGDWADVPHNTTILGAGKITGRTSNGWSIGLLDAVTAREHGAVATDSGFGVSKVVEPTTNYFVGRVTKDMNEGDIQLGGIVTSVVRHMRDPVVTQNLSSHAEAAGFESVMWCKDRTYRFATNLARSQVSGDPEAMLGIQRSSARYFQRPDRQGGGNGLFTNALDSNLTSVRGYAGYARFSKESGDWRFELNGNMRSPGFEVNDLAFNTRSDYWWMSGNVNRRFLTPNKVYRRLSFTAGAQQQYNFDGDLTDRQMQASVWSQLSNYWWVSTFFIHRPTVLDDRLTRGGPVVARAGSDYWYLGASTDSRKKLYIDVGGHYTWTVDDRHGYGGWLDVTYRPASNISVTLGPSFRYRETSAQYVTSAEDITAVDFYGQRYVFGDIEQNTISMDTRLNITFTPTLTLEVFLQPYISSGRYSGYKEFAAPRELAQNVYGVDMGTIDLADGVYTVDPDGDGPAESFEFDDPNFNYRSLRGNAVLRWEFRPGSTIFLVWTQSRSSDASVGDMDFGRDMRALFDGPADNIFLLKINYWIGL
jgi:hypothetical protein